jgi:hypothetical protein
VTSPLPLGRRHFGGIGVIEGRISVSIRLFDRRSPAGVHRTKGVVLNMGRAPVDWALEVDAIGAFVQIDVHPEPRSTRARPGFVRDVRAAGGHVMSWLDVDALVKEISAPAPELRP